MRLRPVRLVAAGLLALSVLSIQSCDDAEAASRVEVATAINQAADDAFMAGANPDELKQVVRQLKSITGGTDKQLATRDRLLASVYMHLSIIKMGSIKSMEISIRHDFLRLRAKINAAARLSAFASTRESTESFSGANHLKTRREQINSQVEQVRQQSAEMEKPVQVTMEFLESSAEEVSRLHRQAGRLREEAGLVGPLQRFPKIEEAIDLERQADRIEAEMMRKELTLELAYRPAKAMFDRSRLDLEDMLGEIDAAHGSLQQSTQEAIDSAAQARGALKDLDTQITELSKQLSDEMSGPLRTAYTEAGSDLRSAGSNAGKAGRGGTGPLAKDELTLLKTRIELAESDLWTMRVQGLDEWIRMLDLLASNNDLGNRDAWKLEAAEARSQRDIAAEDGTKAIDAVLQSANRTSSFPAMEPNLKATKAYLAGEAMPELVTTTPPARSTPRGDTAAAASTPASSTELPSQAFPTPEALVSAFNSTASSGDGAKLIIMMMSSATSSSPAKVQTFRELGRFLQLTMEVQDTANARFGGTMPPELEMGLGMINMIAAARLDPSTIKVTGDTATVDMSMMGQSQPAGMVKTPEGWMINGDEMGGQAPNFGGGPGDIAKLEAILAQLRDGTISNQEQYDQAMSSISFN